MEITLINISFASLFLNLITNWTTFFAQSKLKSSEYIFVGNILATVLLSCSILNRWYVSGHFPLSNLYESLLFLTFVLQVVLFGLQYTTKNILFGVIISPVILFVQAFASFSLPTDMQAVSALVPSLQSNWLVMHVTIMIISYGALLIGCILAITLLILDFVDDSKKTNVKQTQTNQIIESLDDLSYRILLLGFPCLTLGILSGAIWANETWGSYWNWDPKETWALITWFTFASYFHVRFIRGWRGVKSAKVAAVGFVVIWICYLGVNLLGKGLHSYGWWS
jgi:cytochrome c-type biogenesis protein CcsB